MSSQSVQHGHFELESGLHTDTWLDLETAFIDLAALQPRIDALAALLATHAPTAVCGPLAGGALVAQAVATRLGARFYFTERASADSSGLFSATYRLPVSVRTQAARERFAVVDDAISAGSSTRATVTHLDELGATTVAVGAIWLLGNHGEQHFLQRSIDVVAVERVTLSLWEPAVCPLCRTGTPLSRRA